jgi:hypothetical protein
LEGVAVDWKLTGKPASPVAGTVAVQASVQLAVMVMEPPLVQVVPLTDAVIVHV